MLDKPFDLLVTGIGGTGVITIGALIAHGRAPGGQGRQRARLHRLRPEIRAGAKLSAAGRAFRKIFIRMRIDDGAADALIGCDVSGVASSPKASATYRSGMGAVVNSAEMPTGDIVRQRDADLLNVTGRLGALAHAHRYGEPARPSTPTRWPSACAGDAVFANMIMLELPGSRAWYRCRWHALMRAIDLNKVAVDKNKAAFAIGRLACATPRPCRKTADRPTSPKHSMP